MKRYDLQGIQLDVPMARAFAYLADPQRLPEWTHAFAAVHGERATMHTPRGEVEVQLRVAADAQTGMVDWIMTFPGGSTVTAYSRLVALDDSHCAYSFVLTPPPAPLEVLEGLLAEQSATLAQELAQLQRILHG